MPWYGEPDNLDTTWLDYDIAKDFSPDQARDDHGRWTSGGGSSAGHSSGYSAWTRSFDSREHDKQIAQHRADEESHRAAGAKIKDQIADIKGRAKTATPKQQATLQRKTEQLKQQYEQHRTAATAARDQRRQVQQDLERARGEHTAARLAVAGARREHEADVVAHEEAGGIAIGGTRIGGSGGEQEAEEHPVEPTAPEQHYSETPEHYMGIGTGEAIRAEPEPEAAPKPKADTPNYRTASDRQVVSYASTGPKTQEEWNAHDQRQREAREASDQRMRARQAAAAAAKPPPEPKQDPLPEARTQSPRPGIMGRLRSLFSRKSVVAKAGAEWRINQLEDAHHGVLVALSPLGEFHDLAIGFAKTMEAMEAVGFRKRDARVVRIRCTARVNAVKQIEIAKIELRELVTHQVELCAMLDERRSAGSPAVSTAISAVKSEIRASEMALKILDDMAR